MIANNEAGDVVVNTGYSVGTAKQSHNAMRFKTREEAEQANKDTSVEFSIKRRFVWFGDYILVSKVGWYLCEYETGTEIYNEGTGLGCEYGSPRGAMDAYHSAKVYSRYRN